MLEKIAYIFYRIIGRDDLADQIKYPERYIRTPGASEAASRPEMTAGRLSSGYAAPSSESPASYAFSNRQTMTVPAAAITQQAASAAAMARQAAPAAPRKIRKRRRLALFLKPDRYSARDEQTKLLSALVIILLMMNVMLLRTGLPFIGDTTASQSNTASTSEETETTQPQYAVYTSSVDQDQDGTDDQTDMLQGVRAYIATQPQYKSKYYSTGYPNDNYGVCTDVVAFGMKAAGYDLMNLMNQDVKANPTAYQIGTPDILIDFRRVVNQNVYFKRHAKVLTNTLDDPEDWQGGDIVVFKTKDGYHTGVISDKRNSQGIPYLIHLSTPAQTKKHAYEQNVLKKRESQIIGHYRLS